MIRLLVRLILVGATCGCLAQEITLEEVRIEAPVISPFELPLNKTIDQFIERLRLRDENARTIELREANKNSLTRLIELTRFMPIPLGGSDSRVDSFLLENYMRPDLNPRETKSLLAPDNR